MFDVGYRLRPGISSLDDILLTAVLGEGSYGTVYKALWRGTEVAVKVGQRKAITRGVSAMRGDSARAVQVA